MNNWKGVYGGTVLSNLAYIKAKKGNYTLAQQYMNNHEKIYGDLGFDHDDIERFKFVSQAIDLNERAKEFNETINPPNKQLQDQSLDEA